jgi:hypothetical protein
MGSMTVRVNVDEQAAPHNGIAGPVFFGVWAAIAGVLGVFFLGLSGLVWRPWEFGSTYHWDSESSFGVGIAGFFFAIAVGLLLWVIVRGLSTWRRRTTAYRLSVPLVPALTIIVVFVGWALLLSPGNSQPTWGL